MPRRPPDRPASPGSVPPETLSDLQFLQSELARRDRAITALLNTGHPRNPVRDECLRIAVAAFGAGHVETISFYERACLRFGSPTTTRAEIHALSKAGVIFLKPSKRDRRALCVVPSERLVNAFVKGLSDIRGRIIARLDE